jgi:hypothetical protein
MLLVQVTSVSHCFVWQNRGRREKNVIHLGDSVVTCSEPVTELLQHGNYVHLYTTSAKESEAGGDDFGAQWGFLVWLAVSMPEPDRRSWPPS